MRAQDTNPIWLAQSKLHRRRYDECIELCTAALKANPLDQVTELCANRRELLLKCPCLAVWADALVTCICCSCKRHVLVPPGGLVPQVPSDHPEKLDR